MQRLFMYTKIESNFGVNQDFRKFVLYYIFVNIVRTKNSYFNHPSF
jgi:hypothetical protein